METKVGKIVKEEFIDDVYYFLDVEFEGPILVNEDKFTNVEDYVGKKVECEVIVWDYRQKRTSDQYKVIGLA